MFLTAEQQLGMVPDKSPLYLNAEDPIMVSKRLKRSNVQNVTFYVVRRVDLMDRDVRRERNNRYLNPWVYKPCMRIRSDEFPEEFTTLLRLIWKREGEGDYDVLMHKKGRMKRVLPVFTVNYLTVNAL